ncbi:uncharacterized protein L969DRAFT_24205 [Mixia osmundae IAM 14324]|uniref:Uncharacterized protein n=1 Tax=Mixia osmundae (strain CBS 9802 / IAM 14324 / JCM 22182 / KY 12970) TaxID=764103 RepID=G7DYX5_MIXOS|nr:uncharacterized protein L969DRAFT_24205 [Mixia osmundae IAM 14324]KEI38617.1 hypothetical protein L969DRAFT_24205 [Mixia osmundae IAM 14324]GAA95785.1 hypothetical protein E5Q_02442 [Mixia osmundae IAM 14324]
MVWLVCYGQLMAHARLQKILETKEQHKSAYVLVQQTFLSFDYRGFPYVTPAQPTCIVQGQNDGPWCELDVEQKQDQIAYIRYLHERCIPGVPFDGRSETFKELEGVAYALSEPELERVLAAYPAYRPLQVSFRTFTDGDLSTLTAESHKAVILAAKEQYRAPRLQPSLQVFFVSMRSALLLPLSQPYLGHLICLKPYAIPPDYHHTSQRWQWRRRRLGIALFKLTFVPLFLFFHLPVYLFSSIIIPVITPILGRSIANHLIATIERYRVLLADLTWRAAIVIEALIWSPLFGSGWTTTDIV